MPLRLLFDRAAFIRRSIAQVEQGAWLGGCIAVIVLLRKRQSSDPRGCVYHMDQRMSPDEPQNSHFPLRLAWVV
ncbi:hypothetical protein NKDENANG_03631 [Candidatus Entotheonellaceae bacterium PAL068K]